MVQETQEISCGQQSIRQFAMYNSCQKKGSAILGCMHKDIIWLRRQVTLSLQLLCHAS